MICFVFFTPISCSILFVLDGLSRTLLLCDLCDCFFKRGHPGSHAINVRGQHPRTLVDVPRKHIQKIPNGAAQGGPTGLMEYEFAIFWGGPFGFPLISRKQGVPLKEDTHLGMGQNSTTRGLQVLVLGSIYTGSIFFGYLFLTRSHFTIPRVDADLPADHQRAGGAHATPPRRGPRVLAPRGVFL